MTDSISRVWICGRLLISDIDAVVARLGQVDGHRLIFPQPTTRAWWQISSYLVPSPTSSHDTHDQSPPTPCWAWMSVNVGPDRNVPRLQS